MKNESRINLIGKHFIAAWVDEGCVLIIQKFGYGIEQRIVKQKDSDMWIAFRGNEVLEVCRINGSDNLYRYYSKYIETTERTIIGGE